MRITGSSRNSFLQQVASEVTEAAPSIVVTTGDFVDGRDGNLSRSLDVFKKIAATYGKFVVLGNHEFLADRDVAAQRIRYAGFNVLRNDKHILASQNVCIVGIEDGHRNKKILPMWRLVTMAKHYHCTATLSH